MKNVYLGLAVIGAVVPYLFFIEHFMAAGVDLPQFMSEMFATSVASGAAADLFISSFVFWLFMFSAGKRGPNPWPFILLNLLIGLSCALPAYLFFRKRTADAQGTATTAQA